MKMCHSRRSYTIYDEDAPPWEESVPLVYKVRRRRMHHSWSKIRHLGEDVPTLMLDAPLQRRIHQLGIRCAILWTRCTTYGLDIPPQYKVNHSSISWSTSEYWCVVNVLLEHGCTTNDYDAPLVHHDATLGGLMHHTCFWCTTCVPC